MSIASFGGAIVKSDGTRDYPGSGGMVGGLSFDGGNWSFWGGAGKAYNRFTPNNSLVSPNDNPDTGGSGGGGGILTGSGGNGGGTVGGGTVGGGGGSAIPTGSPTSAPTWLQGVFSSTYNGQPISLNVNPSGTATATLGGQTYGGYIFNYLNQFYLWLNGDTSLLVQTPNGIETQNLSRGGILEYLGLTNNTPKDTNGGSGSGCQTTSLWSGCLDPTTIPVNNPNGGILQTLAGLLAPQNQSYQAPPNLFQVTPTGQTNSQGGNMKNIIILAVVAFAAYWLYKKYA